MKKAFVFAVLSALLLGGCSTPGTPSAAVSSAAGSVSGASSSGAMASFMAMVANVTEDGRVAELVPAESAAFARIYLDTADVPALDFTPASRQMVRVELQPGYVFTSSRVIRAAAKSIRAAQPVVPVQYIRANGSYDVTRKAVAIVSRQALAEYYESNRANFQFDLDYQHPDFHEAIAKYDDAFFSGRYLVVVVLCAHSGTFRHIVTGITDGVIRIKCVTAGVATADMASWHILLELGKSAYPVRDYTVDEF